MGVGAAVLTYPMVVRKLGWVIGMGCLWCACALSTLSCITVSKAIDQAEADGVRVNSFGDVGQHFLGKAGKVLCGFGTLAILFGKSAMYTLLVGQNLEFLVPESWFGGIESYLGFGRLVCFVLLT